MSTAESNAPQWLVRLAASSWRLLVLFALLYSLAVAAQVLRLVVVPLVVALFITAILYRPTRALRRIRVPLALSSILGAALFVMVLAAAVLAAGLIIRGQRSDIVDSIARGWETLRAWLAQRQGAIAGIPLDDIVTSLSSSLEARAGDVAGLLAAGAAGLATAIAEVVFAAVLAFFLLRDGEALVKTFLERLPEDSAREVADIGSRMWARVEGYLRGIALSSLAVTSLFGISLALIGVPFVVPIMFITFVASFVPYAGPITATILAALVAMGHGGGSAALWVIASGIVVQQIEGHLLEPFVVGHAVSLPPVVVLLALACGAAVAGLFGTFIAVPVAAAVAVLFEPSSMPEKPS